MRARDVNWQAVRAFNRVMAPIQQGMDLQHHYDRHFDGGEWSDPAHAELQEKMALSVADKVGARFDIMGMELLMMIDVANHVNNDALFRALMKRGTGGPPFDAATATGMYDH